MCLAFVLVHVQLAKGTLARTEHAPFADACREHASLVQTFDHAERRLAEDVAFRPAEAVTILAEEVPQKLRLPASSASRAHGRNSTCWGQRTRRNHAAARD